MVFSAGPGRPFQATGLCAPQTGMAAAVDKVNGMSQERKSFTVNDRRHFTSEGEPREDPEDRRGARRARCASGRVEAQAFRGEPPVAEFGPFILSLAAQAGYLLAAEGEEAATGLEDARHLIAIIEMLKDKTEGPPNGRRRPDPRDGPLRAPHGLRGTHEGGRSVTRVLLTGLVFALIAPGVSEPAEGPEKPPEVRVESPRDAGFARVLVGGLRSRRSSGGHRERPSRVPGDSAPARRAEHRGSSGPGPRPRRAGRRSAQEGRSRSRRGAVPERCRPRSASSGRPFRAWPRWRPPGGPRDPCRPPGRPSRACSPRCPRPRGGFAWRVSSPPSSCSPPSSPSRSSRSPC